MSDCELINRYTKHLLGLTFRSGNAEHPRDIFYNTSVELRLTDKSDAQLEGYPAHVETPSGATWVEVGTFSDRGNCVQCLNVGTYIKRLQVASFSTLMRPRHQLLAAA